MTKIETGSNNVFKDLGYNNSEERLLKAELARLINLILDAKKTKCKWTQSKIAEVMGIPQSKVSLLSRGIVSGFSVEKLLFLLHQLGHDIIIRIKAPSAGFNGKVKGKVKVVSEY